MLHNYEYTRHLWTESPRKVHILSKYNLAAIGCATSKIRFISNRKSLVFSSVFLVVGCLWPFSLLPNLRSCPIIDFNTRTDVSDPFDHARKKTCTEVLLLNFFLIHSNNKCGAILLVSIFIDSFTWFCFVLALLIVQICWPFQSVILWSQNCFHASKQLVISSVRSNSLL